MPQGRLLEKCARQERDIVTPIAEGGQFDGHHVEPVVEILAKLPVSRQLMEVTVRGRDHADIDLGLTGTTEPRDAPLLKNPKERRLQGQRHGGDLIEKKRPTVGLFEFAFPASVGAGERSLLVAEEFGLDQALGDRGAVDRDKGGLAPATRSVEGPRNELLAGPGLAGDEDRGVGGRDFFDGAVEAFHDRESRR